MPSTTQTDLQLFIPDISTFVKSVVAHLTNMASALTSISHPTPKIVDWGYTTRIRNMTCRSYIESVITDFNGESFVVKAIVTSSVLAGDQESYRYTVRQVSPGQWQLDEEVEILT